MTAMISDCPSAAHPNGKQPARPGGQGASRQIRGIRPRRPPAQAGHPATAAPSPLLDGLGPTRVWVAAAFLLGVIALEVLGGPEAAGRALQHALELAEPDRVLVPSLRHPPPGPRGRHHQHPSTDEGRIGPAAGLPPGADRPATPPPAPARHLQALTHGETRVLRYLPANLSAPEIADQLYLSVHTVKTHQRHLYQKLGAHPDPGCPASPRTTIEQRLAEIIRAFCADALSSTVNLNVDLDIMLCVLAQALLAAFRARLGAGYAAATPDTLQRRFLDSSGTISLSGNAITVRIDRRAYSPVLRQASLPPDTTVPWWHGRRLHFEFS